MERCELVIIGAGAAGLAAALYAARARLDFVAIERMGAGGQLINIDQIDDYPGLPAGSHGMDLATRLAAQALEAGARIVYGEVTALAAGGQEWLVRGDDFDYRCNAVIVAAGSTLSRLGVPGETALEGRGVSYCATCDGDFCADQAVAVIGGGDSAFDEAEYLSRICSQVTIVFRGAEPSAGPVLRERAAANPRIVLLPSTEVVRIDGEEQVHAISLRNLASGGSMALEVAGVFIYVGLTPNSQFLAGLLPLDAAGHIKTDLWMACSFAGIFAAGDIRSHSARQIGSCIGDGITAAIAAERYIRGMRG